MPRSLRHLEIYPITTRTLEVLRVSDVTPGMRRVTLGGEQLAAHIAENGYPVAAFRSDGFDDEGKLFLKHPDADALIAPKQADGVLHWPHHEHLLHRTYTVRRWDPIAGEFDLDFVNHGVGPATTWANTVQPGEKVQWAGPKMSASHPVGADWTLVAGDETALPAIGRWLEVWPDGARGQVFIEVAEASHRQELSVPDGVELTWLVRDGAEPGTTTLLFDALQAAPWWDGDVFAWVAGETLTLIPIRRWLRNEKGLAKENVEVTGYWRRREVVVSDDSGVQDLDATTDDAEAFHELQELTPGFALRIAATIGLGPAVGAQTRSLEYIAEATKTDATALAKLVRYLEAIGVTETTDSEIRLTPLGRALDDDEVIGELDLTGAAAQRELGGLLSLLTAVRTGTGDYDRWFDKPWPQHRIEDSGLVASRLESEASRAGYLAGAVVEAGDFDEAGTVTVLGHGAGTFATALVETHPNLAVRVVGAPSELTGWRRIEGERDRIEWVPGNALVRQQQTSDVVLLVDVLSSLDSEDATHALREAAASVTPGGRVLVFGNVLEPELADEHDYESDIIEFALTGGGARMHEEHLALFAAAGLAEPQRETVGWGYTLYAV